MDYFEYHGQQTQHGVALGKLITNKVSDILDGIHNIKNKEQHLTNLFYQLCHNDNLLYRLHKEYCESNKVYSDKYKEIPFSPKLRNQVFQIMVCVINYEFTKYKIMNNKEFKENTNG